MGRIELGSSDIRRANWYGAKPALAKLLGTLPLNSAIQLAGRALLPMSVARRLPLNKPSVRYRLDGGGSVTLLNPLHDTLAREIYWGGGKAVGRAEQHKLACLERLSKSADLFIDIGAYAGICSLIAVKSNPRLKAVAYEIVPENFLLLTRNVIENDVVGRIEPRLRGVGAERTSLTLPEGFGAASYEMSISLGANFASGISIPIVPLDEDFIEECGRVLIKIDVEGFEDQVFKGAEGIVRRCRPDIICEILPNTDESARAISEMLSPLGYKWFCFEEHGIQPRDELQPGQVMRDWLFTADPAVAAGVAAT
jgi:FkbM family methyltransferase